MRGKDQGRSCGQASGGGSIYKLAAIHFISIGVQLFNDDGRDSDLEWLFTVRVPRYSGILLGYYVLVCRSIGEGRVVYRGVSTYAS